MSQKASRQNGAGRRVLILAQLAAIVLIAAEPSLTSVGRSLYLDNPERGSLTLEICRPHFPGSGLPLTTAGFFATVRAPLGRRTLFVIEVPYASMGSRASTATDYYYRSVYEESGNTLGNVFVGLEIPSSKGTSVDLGVRLNTMSDQRSRARLIGLSADLDRPAAFEQCMGAAVSLTLINREHYDSGLETTILAGPYLYIPGGQCGGGLPMVLLQYGGSLGFSASRVTVRTGFSGLLAATSCNADFAERTIHQWGVNVSYTAGAWSPGVGLRVRLDEVPYDYGQDYTLALNLVYAFR